MKWRVAFIVLVVAAILSFRSIAALIFVDRCLDAGGSVNYAEWICSTNRDFPTPPADSWVRAPGWISVATAGAATLGLIAAFAGLDRRKRRSTLS